MCPKSNLSADGLPGNELDDVIVRAPSDSWLTQMKAYN
jgi:hypothetical protein